MTGPLAPQGHPAPAVADPALPTAIPDAAAGGREAARQQAMLNALASADPGFAAAWLRGAPAQQQRGLRAYRANAGAAAERALGTAYPTVAALLGAASLSGLARAYWQAEPPCRGDLGTWGDGLASFIERSDQLADEPYLADTARLDWAVHVAGRADDESGVAVGLERLGDTDPAELRLRLTAGTAVLGSRWPIVSIRAAHESRAADRFEPVRAALAAGHGEHALVWRDGWHVRVAAIDAADAAYTRDVLTGADLHSALERAGAAFDFTGWLTQMLQRRALAAVVTLAGVNHA